MWNTARWKVQMQGMWYKRSCSQIWFTHFSNQGEVSKIYSLATAGKFGKNRQSKTSEQQTREELHARGDYDPDKVKDELQKKLDNTLCGIQLVPTMFLDPKQSHTQLHLELYTVLVSERLHDLKWHHLFAELLYLQENIQHVKLYYLLTRTQ